MKLRVLLVLLTALLLDAGIYSPASAQEKAYGSRRNYTVYAPDSSLDKIYNERYGEYPTYAWHEWMRHPRRYYRRRYWEDRRNYDYYYDRNGRNYRRYRDTYDDDRYYYRGGGY